MTLRQKSFDKHQLIVSIFLVLKSTKNRGIVPYTCRFRWFLGILYMFFSWIFIQWKRFSRKRFSWVLLMYVSPLLYILVFQVRGFEFFHWFSSISFGLKIPLQVGFAGGLKLNIFCMNLDAIRVKIVIHWANCIEKLDQSRAAGGTATFRHKNYLA